MKLSTFTSVLATSVAVATGVLAESIPFERLNLNDTALLIIDLQVGLYQLARDFDHTVYYNNIIAHSALGNLFDLPTVLTTSAQQGPNGPLPKEILDMYPTSPLIMRQGEVNAWDNADFRAAVKATGKKQLVMAGIVTDVCTTFLALSLRQEGYSVWANLEASGTTTPLIRDNSNDIMRQAGVKVVSLFYIVCDLMRDWRNTPGSAQVLPWLAQYYPVYGNLAKGHAAAIANGSVIPGEAGLI
ncbi:hypothetical protein MMC10_005492 [Thelotrema lepadinum]|nr:hypothetical protein [Thelotrema lepadinum]